MRRSAATDDGRAAWAGLARACAADGPADLIADLRRRLGSMVPHDAVFIAATDPLTGLATSPAIVDNIDERYCGVFWEQEFGGDLLPFAELARSRRRAGGMNASAGSRARDSGRFRHMMRPSGFGDEARVVFTDGGATWGVAALYRENGRPPFDEADLGTLERLAPMAAAGLRARALDHGADHRGMPLGPGLLVLDDALRVVSMNDDADAWLRLLPEDPHAAGRTLARPRPQLMTEILNVARRARAGLGPDPGRPAQARLRVRSSSGLWLTIHASRLQDALGDGPVAVVIEAAKGSEMAPIIAEALGLTPREQEITHAVARGEGTGEIARRLHLSPHTVRDHLKSIFDKAGVSSRGELVARLFADHYMPRAFGAHAHR